MCAPDKSCTCRIESNAAMDRAIAAALEMDAATAKLRPSVIWRPSIAQDGGQWRVLYGDNLQDGVAGFGKTPEEAMADFDKNWKTATVKPCKDCGKFANDCICIPF